MEAARNLPFDAFVVWRDRKKGDPWPDNAPWSADTPWAKMALILESEGDSLAHACSEILLHETRKGNPRPLAQWFAAGWAPAQFVLWNLAGFLSEEDSYTNGNGEKIGAKQAKGNGTKLSALLRDHEIGERFRLLLAEVPGGYLSITKRLAGEYFVSEATIRKAYDTFTRQNPGNQR